MNFNHKNSRAAGFTLPELLIAIAIFSMVATLVSSLYIQSFRETRRANLQNQIYEDARYVMARIADEVRDGMIDYDEYYNQSVIAETLASGGSIPGRDPAAPQHYGQNYGRYYSSFFHPGSDGALGFDCNDGGGRNRRECTPLRRTLDRHTGQNPFSGKAVGEGPERENVFCGTVREAASMPLDNNGACSADGAPDLSQAREQDELYLISADGFQKTILAREKIGAADDAYALSILRLKGVDTNSDDIADHFVCADGFECRGGDDLNVEPDSDPELNLTSTDPACGGGGAAGAFIHADLPRLRVAELEAFDVNNPEGDACDTRSGGFSKDFVPFNPFRVRIIDLKFYIAPLENPHYAFAESDSQEQPRVTVVLTVADNSDVSGIQQTIPPFTLVQTVSSRMLTPVPAPILVR